jgi:hypothetical protein
VAGVFPQRLRVERADYPRRIANQLAGSLDGWKEMLAQIDQANTQRVAAVKDIIKFCEKELGRFATEGE